MTTDLMVISERGGRVNSPDNSLHQSHGKNNQQEHVEGQHGPLEYPTMGDLERSGEGPAYVIEY